MAESDDSCECHCNGGSTEGVKGVGGLLVCRGCRNDKHCGDEDEGDSKRIDFGTLGSANEDSMDD